MATDLDKVKRAIDELSVTEFEQLCEWISRKVEKMVERVTPRTEE